jgi:hypothetical protein
VSYPAVVAAVSAVAAIAAAVITAILGRRSASEANRIDAFEASLDGLGKVVEAQDKRIKSLESELGTVKTALVDEQQQHGATRELLRLALKHIRYMRAWLAGDRSGEPPWVPDELNAHL